MLMKSLKNIFQNWSNEDTIIAGSFFVGFGVLTLVVFMTPLREIATGSVASLAPEAQQDSTTALKARKGNARGMFRFGRLVVSLGEHDEYLDSDLDIEYDMGVMRVHADGTIEDIKGANKFCEKNKNKMKDAIISAVSMVSVGDIKSVNGYDDFKTVILDAVNEAMSENENIFTNVFFRKFLLLPAGT